MVKSGARWIAVLPSVNFPRIVVISCKALAGGVMRCCRYLLSVAAVMTMSSGEGAMAQTAEELKKAKETIDAQAALIRSQADLIKAQVICRSRRPRPMPRSRRRTPKRPASRRQRP